MLDIKYTNVLSNGAHKPEKSVFLCLSLNSKSVNNKYALMVGRPLPPANALFRCGDNSISHITPFNLISIVCGALSNDAFKVKWASAILE